ncbi:MAG: ABC transporter ATP-binding protein [Thermoplasmatota archaeon]
MSDVAGVAGRNGHIVSARGVMKTYRTGDVVVNALADVHLEVAPGEMVAIMGPSGCGKTTLLNCLSGLDEIDGGSVFVDGREIHKLGDNERTRMRALRMGFVFQAYNLLPVLSAAENVELPLLVAGVPPGKARERASAALASVGLAGRETHKPAELSGGEQQRVTIARSLVNEPAIVWADEPTGNLDTKTGLEILSIMRRLNEERGETYVIVTHDARLAKECHRIVYMESGRIVKEEQVRPR